MRRWYVWWRDGEVWRHIVHSDLMSAYVIEHGLAYAGFETQVREGGFE